LYMSPEHAAGDEPGGASDIYALGAVAYFLLSGRPPFDHQRPMKVLLAHTNETPAALSEIRADVPDDLAAVVMRCLAKDPADRFDTAAWLKKALEDCADAGTWDQQQAEMWWKSRPGANSEPRDFALTQYANA